MNKAAEWAQKARQAARKDATELELPSGMVIRARRPGPLALAGWGRLPLSLATAANGGGVDAAPLGRDEAVQFTETLRDLLLYCVVEPAISLHPADGEIHPGEIPDDDLNYILAWAMRGPEAVSLESFRSKRHDDRAGQGGTGVSATAVNTAGNRRSAVGAKSRSRGRTGAHAGTKRG